MRKAGNNCYFFLILLFIISCSHNEPKPHVQINTLNYPSASSVEFHNNKLYVMGDDAPNLLVLDTNLNVIDSIRVITYPGKRIPKDIKPDLEASALISHAGNPALFLLGSGSLSPYRNSGWRYLSVTRSLDSLTLGHRYELIKQSGIDQLNIEGACFIGDSLILSNRGNKNYPKNYLIITSEDFWRYIDDSIEVKKILINDDSDTSSFKGISGLCYAKMDGQLIMTVSTEDTRNAYEDGPIGKSYLWIIDSISHRLKAGSLKPDKVIELEKIDPRFKGQKIESATIIEETKDAMRLVLVADNDDGSSTVFKLSIKKD